MSCSGKKLINSAETCVDDNLAGFVALNPGVRLLKGHRVLVRADIDEFARSGRVAVVSGGGSGHEPAFSGYVGRGMLTAATMGPVFASPPPNEMLAALRAASNNNTAGVLLVIANYTGDRLNFGLAAERARGEGLSVGVVVVGEDCALTTADRSAGRRGLTGIPIAIKIAGALSEEGWSLEDIVLAVKNAVVNMATIGVALSPCFVPGSGPTFHLPDDEMELGLGVHGEAGVRRLKLTSAKETVAIMLDHMTSPDNINHLHLHKGDRVAVFINSLGGISQMDLNIVAKEAIEYLECRGMLVVRALSAPFITSLEMAGTHVTVLRLDDTVTRCLDAPTAAPMWPRTLLSPGETDRHDLDPLTLPGVDTGPGNHVTTGPTCSPEEGSRLHCMLTAACDALVEGEGRLNALDSGAGDGDCGSTLARGARGVLAALGPAERPGLPVCRPALLAFGLADIAQSQMGGASGALYSLLLTGAAVALSEDRAGGDVWAAALGQGIDMVKRYGGAEPGDRTMLDALQPALETLEAARPSTSTADRLRDAAHAAESGAAGTAGMVARAGRASYVSPSLQQQPDPGATGVAVWLRAACAAFTASLST